MSEKRFIVENERTVYDNLFHRGYVCSWKIDAQELVGLLNKQQATIEEQNKQIEEWEFSFRTEMAHHRVAEKELQDKIREQQATINKLKSELNDCEKFRYQVFKGMEKIIGEKKNDNGGFQVWEVPPIPKGKRISFTTNDDGGDGV